MPLIGLGLSVDMLTLRVAAMFWRSWCLKRAKVIELGVVGACLWLKALDRSSSSLIDLFVAITLLFDTLLFANCRILHQKTYVETLNHNHVIYTLEAVFLEKIYIDVHAEEIRHKLAVHTSLSTSSRFCFSYCKFFLADKHIPGSPCHKWNHILCSVHLQMWSYGMVRFSINWLLRSWQLLSESPPC